jgi:hypothetical protein
VDAEGFIEEARATIRARELPADRGAHKFRAAFASISSGGRTAPVRGNLRLGEAMSVWVWVVIGSAFLALFGWFVWMTK